VAVALVVRFFTVASVLCLSALGKTQYSISDVRAGTKAMSMVSISADEQWLQRLDCNAGCGN
jgi:hypothetical protein